MITMTEIARLTQVSQPTVSRVLNGSKTVAPEIRERVLACARTHDYQFNALARSLQGSKTNLLGVILSDISNSFFADLEREIEAKARQRGYSIILFNSDLNPLRQLEYLDILRRYRVDGLLMTPTLSDTERWNEFVGKLDIPTVMITIRVDGFDSVYLDHAQAGGQVARYLVERGYGRFLFVGPSSDGKYIGFARELGGMNIRTTSISEENDDALRRDLEAYLRRPGPRAGIFACNDICAVRVLRALWEIGIRVPEDAGLIGFDNICMCRYLRPSLSSIIQPIVQMVDEAVTRLFYRIDHPNDEDFLDFPLQATLIPREST